MVCLAPVCSRLEKDACLDQHCMEDQIFWLRSIYHIISLFACHPISQKGPSCHFIGHSPSDTSTSLSPILARANVLFRGSEWTSGGPL